MIWHGIAKVGSIKMWAKSACCDLGLTRYRSYTRQVTIIGFFTCSVAAILFRIAGAPNLSSSLLVSITIAMFDQVEDVSISLCVKEVGRALGIFHHFSG